MTLEQAKGQPASKAAAQTDREGSREAKNPTQGVEALVERLKAASGMPTVQGHPQMFTRLLTEAAQALTNQAARIKALEEALREAEGFISATFENFTNGEIEGDDAREVLELIRACQRADQ